MSAATDSKKAETATKPGWLWPIVLTVVMGMVLAVENAKAGWYPSMQWTSAIGGFLLAGLLLALDKSDNRNSKLAKGIVPSVVGILFAIYVHQNPPA